MRAEGMRLWAGQQRKGAVVGDEWKGAEPLWNIGIHVRSRDVQLGLNISEVAKVIKSALEAKFPSYDLEISPKAKEVLEGIHDGFSSFPNSSS